MWVCLSVGARPCCGARACGEVCAWALSHALLWRRAALLIAMLALAATARAATLPSGFTETQIAGLSNPTAMAFAPDGRLFICEQGGTLRVIKNGALLATPFLTVTVDSSGERGLLGIAFDPNFATNHFLYVYYTAITPATHNRVSRFTANGDVAVSGSEVVLLDLNNLSSATNHNGGAIHFGPDGKLYIAVGENANSANSQTVANLLGKMLRINSDGTIPADNPTSFPGIAGSPTGVNRAIWAVGLRNPFTFGFQAGTGRLFINDVGQNTWEEINEGIAGSNYGWPNCEGFCSPTNANYRDPLYVYNHSTGTPTGCAIVGGAFYNPQTAQFPASYVGKYFFADLCTGFIRYIDPTTTPPITASTPFATGISSPVDLQVSADGSLWYLARGSNTVFRIQFPAGQVPPSITQHPADQTVVVGQSASFSVDATGATPLNYQWQRNNVDIAGANSATYNTPAVSLADNGAQFRCIVTNAFGSAPSNSATLTVVQTGAGGVLISEFRPRGSAGAADEFVELYNNTDQSLTVSTTDGSAGWAVVALDSSGTTMTPLAVITNGTQIPARAHFLITNAHGYSLGNYPSGAGTNATGDLAYNPNPNDALDLADNTGVALFNTSTPANFTLAHRLDAAGFNALAGATADLFREGTGLTSAGANDGEYSFVRKLNSGTAQDTGDNAQDFAFVSTTGNLFGVAQSQLGAPGPENLASPIQRNATVKASLIEPQQSSSLPPNRVRTDRATCDQNPDPAQRCNDTTSRFGTLDIRRRFKNGTGQSITRLRFRVVDVTTLNSPGGPQADLRVLSANNFSVTTSLGSLNVFGTLIETPPAQTLGGGLDTSVTVALPAAIAAGQTIDVHFLLGVEAGGNYRFLINVEAATNGTTALHKGNAGRAPINSAGGVCNCKLSGKL